LAAISVGTIPQAMRKDSAVIRPYVEREPDVLVDTSPRGELERLYRDQRDRMWRAVFAFAGDPDVASDAVAEAFAQALRRGPAIRSPERWLWRTVFRIAAGELKRRRQQGSEPMDGAYEMDEPARDLVAALTKLPPKQRTAVVLHHAVGYPAKEIARITGSTTPAVHVQLSRARKRLRELLGVSDA
jgi:RNA polymerase sigma-70 factor, ECF subfamily